MRIAVGQAVAMESAAIAAVKHYRNV